MPALSALQGRVLCGARQLLSELPAMQLRTLRFVAAWWLAHDKAPRGKDIAWHLNKSESTANDHVRELLAKGLLHRTPGKQLSLVVTDKGSQAIADTTAEQTRRKEARLKRRREARAAKREGKSK